EHTRDVKSLGGRGAVGDLRSSDTYRKAAAAHDVLIHAAAYNSESKVTTDRGAIEALLWAARQHEREKGEPPRCVIYTSGCFSLGGTGDEGADGASATDRAAELVGWRSAHGRLGLSAARASVATAGGLPGPCYVVARSRV